MIFNLKGRELSLEDEVHLFGSPADLVYLVEAGSITHGTKDEENNPYSDYDVRGVCIYSVHRYLGLREIKEAHVAGLNEIDVAVYDIKKFMKLVLAANPSILEHLFVAEENRLYVDDAFKSILEHRDSFLSKRAYATFMGYAKQQLDKMEAGKTGRDMGEKRKFLVSKYGYDTKNAMHVMRLLYTGIELLTTGKMSVRRPNSEATVLKDIRNGAWSLEKVKAEATSLFEYMEDLKETGKIVLPDEPQDGLASSLTEQSILRHSGYDGIYS